MPDATISPRISWRGKYNLRHLPTMATILAVVVSPAFAQEMPYGGTLGKSDRLIATLPGDAGSVVETFGQWTLRCATVETVRSCLIGQIRADSETGERIFVMELHPPRDGMTNGVLLMPFGLKLPDGVRLTIDGRNLGREVPFESCLTAGCIVRLSLPDIATEAMRAGKELSVHAIYAGDTNPTAFTVALDGLPAALDRLSRLSD